MLRLEIQHYHQLTLDLPDLPGYVVTERELMALKHGLEGGPLRDILEAIFSGRPAAVHIYFERGRIKGSSVRKD